MASSARYYYGKPQAGLSWDEQKTARVAVGAWLQSLREQAGISQNDLAKLVGVDKAFISKVENGKLRIPSGRIEGWASAVGWSVQDLAKELLRRYEPATFALLFPARPHAPSPGRRS